MDCDVSKEGTLHDLRHNIIKAGSEPYSEGAGGKKNMPNVSQSIQRSRGCGDLLTPSRTVTRQSYV